MKTVLCMLLLLVAAVQTVAAAPVIAAKGPPVDVLVLGTFHFDNPGQDLANTQVDDVLAPRRQAEIGEILDGLARFNPTKIFVESRKRVTRNPDIYHLFLRGELSASHSEVVQLGFRLAQRLKHKEVYAVDVLGGFPFEAVMA